MSALSSTIVVASSFTATPLETPLLEALQASGGPARLEFAQYAALNQYLLAPHTVADGPAAVVLVRVEDWLRASAAEQEDASRPGVREKLRGYIDEFIQSLQVAAEQRAIFLVCCPSRGFVVKKRGLGTLCQTYTSLLSSLAEDQTAAQVVRWDELSELAGEAGDDVSADRLGQVPFTQEVFDRLAGHLAERIAAIKTPSPAKGAGGTRSVAMLEKFLAGLKLRLSLVRAQPGDAVVIEKLERAGTKFRLKTDPRTEADIEAALAGAQTEVWRVNLSDRFGEHEDCGFVELDRGEDLKVRQLILTCPVLGKQAEHSLMLQLGRLGVAAGCRRVRVSCDATSETALAHEFMSELRAAVGTTAEGDEFVFPADAVEQAVLSRSVAPAAIEQSAASTPG